LSVPEIRRDRCVMCGCCVDACAFSVLSLDDTGVVVSEGCRLCGACAGACPAEAIVLPERSAPHKKDERDSQGVMVFAEIQEGRFDPVTFELIGKGRELADKVGQKLSAVVAGDGIENLSEELLHYGVDEVLQYDDSGLRYFVPASYADILEDAVDFLRPSVLLIGATPVGRSLAPRLSTRLRTGLTADCTLLDIRPNGELVQTRPAFGGNLMATIVTRYARPQMATVRHKVMPRAQRREQSSGTVQVRQITPLLKRRLSAALAPNRVLSQDPVPAPESIADARVMVIVGRGVRSERDLGMFDDLARRLGGVLGCSRPLVEKGWMPASRQVGLSGRTVSPDLCIVLGVSGAIQHIAGMSGSKTIIAVNKDPDAPIFGVAHYAVTGDLYEVVPALWRQLSESEGGGS
jgi:electron transfer flavoprotein alpha subunit